MSEPPNEPPKPVHITIGADGQVTGTVDGEPLDVEAFLAKLKAVTENPDDA